jgi:hypothetical protein
MTTVKTDGASRAFASLSLKDLLAARDQYHFHLMNKANVVGTAIGRYLIRKGDAWPKENRATTTPEGDRKPPTKEARTLENSEVRDYSWPCVIAVVSHWVSDFGTDVAHELHPSELVPKTLYLPDGRMVPVCIVEAAPRPQPRSPGLPSWTWPAGALCPGYPVTVEHQRVPRVASIGCLVTDGHTTFALTNRHVAGAPGEPVFSYFGGHRYQICRASDHQLTRVPFEQVYPDYPSRRTYLNADVGLVELDDLTKWSSNIFDLGPVGELVDLHEANLGLLLIDAPVRAHGAVSGRLDGVIKGLFYRYKSVGGYDYVADFLIGPTADHGTTTQEGDSGTVWHLVRGDGEQLAPLAVEWGAQAIASARGGQQNFALATGLANVCKLLDVELVRDVDTGAKPTWGRFGHYTIGAYATTLCTAKLGALMTANRDRISFAEGSLSPPEILAVLTAAANGTGMVPLADVPDEVWKKSPDAVGGRGKPENPTHYADIDEPNPQQGGTTLMQLCEDATNVSVAVWQEFYTQCGHPPALPASRGLLPFRVWQFYDAMVDALTNPSFTPDQAIDRFVAAAGIVAHYVGDASQPLHASMFSNGYLDGRGKGVHVAYESTMLEADSIYPQVVTKIQEALGSSGPPAFTMGTGQEVAVEVVNLMRRSSTALPPMRLTDFYIAHSTDADLLANMWAQFRDLTIGFLADSSLVLAALWNAAWTAGEGDAVAAAGARDVANLRALYEDPTFVPSLDLDHIGAVLK